MAHDVFISHSNQDKTIADATCAWLERQGIRCWIAPRDIRPGDTWGSAIIDAIRKSRVMILVFSRHANESPQIKREVERAIHLGVTVIPMRIENVLPEGDLEFFLGMPHWLDAFTTPLELHLDALAKAVKDILAIPVSPSVRVARSHATGMTLPPAPPGLLRPEPPSPRSFKPWLIAGIAVVLIGLVFLVYYLGKTPGQKLQNADASSQVETAPAVAKAEATHSSGLTAGPVADPILTNKILASSTAYQPGQDGYLNFKFGMSPHEVVAAMKGQLTEVGGYLYQAGEYKNDDVRYFSVLMNSIPNLPNYGAHSDTSTFYFFFLKDKLFRISLRFINDNSCPDHQGIYYAFAANNGDAVRYLAGNKKKFRADGGNDFLVGELSVDGVFMTFIQDQSPLSVGENYSW